MVYSIDNSIFRWPSVTLAFIAKVTTIVLIYFDIVVLDLNIYIWPDLHGEQPHVVIPDAAPHPDQLRVGPHNIPAMPQLSIVSLHHLIIFR